MREQDRPHHQEQQHGQRQQPAVPADPFEPPPPQPGGTQLFTEAQPTPTEHGENGDEGRR